VIKRRTFEIQRLKLLEERVRPRRKSDPGAPTRNQRQSGWVVIWAEATMLNPYLPPEILDYIVDLLHDNPNALKECCLVSKSWTPRTRKHIFANVELYTEEDLESWKELFPDPSTSPSRYTNTLHVGCPYAVTPADAEAGGWIRGFSRVMNLELDTSHDRFTDELGILLVPFHGLSPVIKSLRVDFVILPPSCIFNLILSFPLLEDLILIGDNTPVDNGGGLDGLVTAVQPSKQPALTGSLELLLHGGTVSIAHRLLSLPGGIHFQKLELVGCREKDLSLVTALVEKCSYTLEYLDITCWIPGRYVHSTSSPTSMTSVFSQAGAAWTCRPLEGDGTQRHNLSARIAKC